MPQEIESFDAEEFWDDLLAFIEGGRVIPVVGAELLTTADEEGNPVPLYRELAVRLLAKYRLSANALPNGGSIREHHELNDAVCALAASGRRLKDLYRPIHDLLQQILARQKEAPLALRQLASIRHFDLFATTTPDDLLARAIDTVRFGGRPQTAQIEYAPALPTDRRNDIPELFPSNYSAVFYFFGKADVSPFYAIHDEDALEFPYSLQYTLQNGIPPARMFSEMRSRSLLLIGCNFADWLSRFFLRVSNERRLASDERPKKEFLVDRTTTADGNLTVFLERFSRDSRCYSISAAEFMTELHRRWLERNPPVQSAAEAPNLLPGPVASPAGDSIFISYASEDVGAARRLFEALQKIGAEVAWFDKTALKPGDDWHRKIIGAVQRCNLFLPLISANTEQRTEGYFRLEWNEAADRSRKIQGRKFILPVVTDPDFSSGMGAYALVPEAFRTFQYSHAPAGEMAPSLEAEITQHLRNLRRRPS